MKKQNTCSSLSEALTVGLTCVEQGLEGKGTVQESILTYVAEHYINMDEISTAGNVPIALLELLNRVFGISFEVNDGRTVRLRCTAPAGFGIEEAEGGD